MVDQLIWTSVDEHASCEEPLSYRSHLCCSVLCPGLPICILRCVRDILQHASPDRWPVAPFAAADGTIARLLLSCA